MRRHEGDPEEVPLLTSAWTEPEPPPFDRALKARSDRLKILTITLICFILVLGEYLFEIPGPRILEDIICRHYYEDIAKDRGSIAPNGKIDEKLCKGARVQSELAIVIAGIQLLAQLPCLICSFLYGSLADRIGRKMVFSLCIVGNILYMAWLCMVCWYPNVFPVRLVWIGPLFLMIGGGDGVAQNMIYAMISDLTTDATRANTFFLVVCGGQVAGLIGPAASAYLMSSSPWIPRLLAFPIFILGTLLLIFVPETLHPYHNSSSTSAPKPVNFKTLISLSSIRTKISSTFAKLRHTPHILPISLLLVTFLLQAPNRQVIEFSIRFMSKRFDWSLANTSYLLSFRAAVNILLLLLILPYLSHTLTSGSPSTNSRPTFSFSLRKNLSSHQKDLLLARTSILFLAAGSVLIALSAFRSVLALTFTIAGVMIYTLGTALPPLCRSLVTTLVEPQQVGRLYAMIAFVETIGALLCAPGLAGMYAVGLRWAKLGGKEGVGQLGWLGLPFWGTAAWMLLIGGCVFYLRLPRQWEEEQEEEEEGAAVTVEEAEFLEESLLGEYNH